MNFVRWSVSKVFQRRFRNLKTICEKRLKVFQKRSRDLRELLIDEITDFEKVMNEELASWESILLMILNNRSRRLKTSKDEKNEDEKILKLCLCAFDNVEKFVNKRTLMMKWETAVFELLNSWTVNLLNRSFINRGDQSSKSNIDENNL